MKGDKMAKRSSLGTIVRKRLSDITNSLPQPKSPAAHEARLLSGAEFSTTEYVDRLLKENMALTKLIGEKNKIIELSGIELQKLRVNLQKMQLQNWNLAQSNSLILAELNLGKDKFKTLRHELTCKDVLLKSKNLELEEQRKVNGLNNVTQLKEGRKGVLEDKPTGKRPCNGSRRHPLRSQSMGPSTSFQQVAEKEKAENKRRCLQRESARPRSHQHEVHDDLFEIDDVTSPVGRTLGTPMHEDGPTSLSTGGGEKDEISARKDEPRESQRTSFGRPSRRAAEKVLSYKEIPVNIKMRRPE